MTREIRAGAIISGTNLNRDLIPAFAVELHRVNLPQFKVWSQTTSSRPKWLADAILLGNAELIPPPDHVWWHTAHADQVRSTLEQALEKCAPFGWRFGEGEGTHAWGWWLSKDVGGDPLEGGGTFRREAVCVECGANHVIGVANVEWDVEAQAWKINELVGEYRCVVCEHEAGEVEWEHADKGLGEDELAERYGEKGHPEHKMDDWLQQVVTRQTLLGYWSWVFDKLDN